MVGRHIAAIGLAPWNHVGVYVGHNEVVHFVRTSTAARPFLWLTSGYLGQVQRVKLDTFMGLNNSVYRVIYNNKVYEAQTIVNRALAALRPGGYTFTVYSLLSNNSKHFAGFVSVNERGMFYVRHLHIG